MRLLVDTNIFLEIILEQEKFQDAKALLTMTTEHEFFISDYSLHSIGLLLFHRKEHNTFREFLQDILITAGQKIVSLLIEDMETVILASQRFNLDFDDAYQYAVAEKLNLTIISLDSDFDKTERKRKIPVEVLKG